MAAVEAAPRGPVAVAAVVLAGGLSSRFGADKSRATWRGRSLAEHVLGSLPAERAQTIVVLRDDQAPDAWPGAQVVRDDPALPEGPLRGVIAGLRACATPLAWIVACRNRRASRSCAGTIQSS